MVENVIAFVAKLGIRCVLIPPLPRHFSRCCVDMYHFDRDFDGADFVADVRDWGIFMAQSRIVRPTDHSMIMVPHLASILGTELFHSYITGKDGVHLKETFQKRLNSGVTEMIRAGAAVSSVPHALPATIPADISLASWKPAFRSKFQDHFPQIVITSKPLTLVPAGGKIKSAVGRGRGMGNRRRPYGNRFNPSRGRAHLPVPFPPTAPICLHP